MSQIAMESPAIEHVGPPWRTRIWLPVRCGVGLVLTAAAILKADQLLQFPLIGRSAWAIVQMLAEWSLGLSLLVGPYPRAIRLVSILIFMIFAGITASKGLAGEASCNCFGAVQTSPWHTLILDIGVLLALLAAKPPGNQQVRARGRLVLLLALGLSTTLPLVWVLAHHAPPSIVTAAQLQEVDGVVVLDPARWVGQELPLFDQIDIAAQLKSGRWKVLLYHHDCPECRKVALRLPTLQGPGEKLAMIQVPPLGELPGQEDLQRGGIQFGKLSDQREWFAATPILLTLDGGRVVQVQEAEQLEPARAAQPMTPTTLPTTAPAINLMPHVAKDPAHLSGELGYVEPDSTGPFTLLMSNPLARPISIRKIESECQCITIQRAPQRIAAGASDRIELSFHAPAQAEQYTKRLTVLTDNAELPSILIQVRARIGLPLSIAPPSIDLGTLKPGQTIQKTLTIHNDGKLPVKLIYSTSADAAAAVLVPKEAIPAGGQRELPLSFTAPKQATAQAEALLTIHTDCPAQGTLPLRVRFAVE